MKYLTTTKAIKNGYSNIICAGYCDLSQLLHYVDPVAYTRGIYGWNYDVYDINGTTICTGYRGMPGRRANNITDYEKKARAIADDYSLSYDTRKAEVMALLHEFCEQA